MKHVLGRRPSASMVVAILALVLAASGTAVAASHLVSGNKLIKKNSLSANRLKNHSITGTQLNLAKLGTVPSATNATNATNANTVGGKAASSFEPASDFIRTGLVKANPGQTVPLGSFGSFTLTLDCVNNGSGNVNAEILASSTVNNSDAYDTQLTPANVPQEIVERSVSSGNSDENDDNAADFFTPAGETWIGDLTVGAGFFAPSQCFANALVSPS